MIARKTLNRKRRSSKAIGNDYGELIVTRTKRGVRILAFTRRGPVWSGRETLATFGFVDLDDASVDRLIRRLQAIRGGRKALTKCAPASS